MEEDRTYIDEEKHLQEIEDATLPVYEPIDE